MCEDIFGVDLQGGSAGPSDMETMMVIAKSSPAGISPPVFPPLTLDDSHLAGRSQALKVMTHIAKIGKLRPRGTWG
jgi:hypothetical protein